MLTIANILDPVQSQLDGTVFDDPASPTPLLKPRLLKWIKTLVYSTLEHHGYAHPQKWLRLYLTGSLTTYQYSPDSDVDISLFVGPQLPEWSRAEMIGVMVSNVDGQHLPGTSHPMQCYVVPSGVTPEQLYQPGLRSAYSLDDRRWVVPPEHDRAHNVESMENGFYVYALEQADKMERLLRYEPDKAKQFWHAIHRRRKSDMEHGKGDYSESNIIYKFLNQRGLLPEIEQLTGEHIAKTAAAPDYWYHVSPSEYRPDIEQGGLLLNPPQKNYDWSTHAIFAYPSLDLARANGLTGNTSRAYDPETEDIWRFPHHPSMMYEADPMSNGYKIYHNIPANQLERVENQTGIHWKEWDKRPYQEQYPHGEFGYVGGDWPEDESFEPRDESYWRNPRPLWSKMAAGEQQMLDSAAGQDLEGLPGPVNVPGYGPLHFHANADIQRIANEYNQANGLGAHPTNYVPVNPDNAARIAQEYEAMPHNPQDPQVAQAYQALANESLAQYQHALNNGYRFEFYPEDGTDPYPNSPREAVMDLYRNKHMYVYPTESGYGSGEENSDHPLLQDSGERWNGRPVTHNDIFRAIHDFYGHAKEGVGFRSHGEDNAYRQHAAMFSPEAQRALAAETRGQNSWVNYGPYGESNQTAGQGETVYAPQKAGLLPEWVSNPDLHAQTQGTFARTAASQIAETAMQAVLQNGGTTIGLDGTMPDSGYAFAPAKSEEAIVPVHEFSPEVVDHYIADRIGELRQPGHYLGIWRSGDDVYLDVSIVSPDPNEALQMAQASNQLAVYDLGSGQEIPVMQPVAA